MPNEATNPSAPAQGAGQPDTRTINRTKLAADTGALGSGEAHADSPEPTFDALFADEVARVADEPTFDQSEAARLHDAGFKLCKLEHLRKRPVGENWNGKPVTSVDPNASGYGIILARNGLCSIDPDQLDLATICFRAVGFNLDEIMAEGVRTRSTRPGSGGRSAFKAMDSLSWVSFSAKINGEQTAIFELRAGSANLQDCLPGVRYQTTKRINGEDVVTNDGAIFGQEYAEADGLTFDKAPELPLEFAAWWERMSEEPAFRRSQEVAMVAALTEAGYDTTAVHNLRFTTRSGGGMKLAIEINPQLRAKFNAAVTVESVLTHHGYLAPKRKGGRWASPGSTGAPSIRRIPGHESLWQSDHQSDPLNGTFDAAQASVVLDHGYDVAAFEAWCREHLHGLKTEEAKADFAEELGQGAAAYFDIPVDAVQGEATEPTIDFDTAAPHGTARMSAEVRDEINRCISAQASLIEAGYSQYPEGGLWKMVPGVGITRATETARDVWATPNWSGIDGAACLANYFKGDELAAEAAWKTGARNQGGYDKWSSDYGACKVTAKEVKLFLAGAADGAMFKSVDLSYISRTELQTAKLSPRIILEQLLYADVRIRIAAGGVGKTTLALYEAARLALGLDLWGRLPDGPKRTIFFSREDQRSILVARLREIMECLFLSPEQEEQVLANVRIIDLSGVGIRLSVIAGDVVMPNSDTLDWIIKVTKEWKPDWLIFDPLVSFGVGESRVNDAEQGIVEAFRVLRNELDACIEGIHHTGKANAREKTSDQYSSRGGTALPDGSRMVAVLNPADAEEWLKETGTTLHDGEDGIVMALPKLSYCAKQEAIFIRRKGYSFSMAARVALSPEDIRRGDAEKVFNFIAKEYSEGRRYSKADLDLAIEAIGLSRAKIRAASSFLKMNARVRYNEVDGQAGSYFEPIFMDFGDDENGEGRRTPQKDDTGMVCGG